MGVDEETHDLMVAMVEKRFKFGAGKRSTKENAAYMRYYRHQDSLSVVDGRLYHDGKIVNIVGASPSVPNVPNVPQGVMLDDGDVPRWTMK